MFSYKIRATFKNGLITTCDLFWWFLSVEWSLKSTVAWIQIFDKYLKIERVRAMTKPHTKRFHGSLPKESYAIVKEVADRMWMSVKTFVSMATIKFALELEHKFAKASVKGRSASLKKARKSSSNWKKILSNISARLMQPSACWQSISTLRHD